MIIKVSDTIYLKFDPVSKTSQTIDVEALDSRKAEIEIALAPMNEPSDADLLVWARQNYMSPERLLEKEKMEVELSKIQQTLGELNGD